MELRRVLLGLWRMPTSESRVDASPQWASGFPLIARLISRSGHPSSRGPTPSHPARGAQPGRRGGCSARG